MDRREFIAGASALTAWAAKEVALPNEAIAQAAPTQVLRPSIWSRHVQWVRTQAQTNADPYGTGVAVGEAILAGGYSAVDLTVRTGGHVDPTLVATNLPLMLNGIRSTGAVCTMIGTNFGPPSNGADTTWITSQLVNEILVVAGANGITKYRYNNAGNTVPSFPANTFGATMTAQLDQVRLSHRRLAALNAQYGGIQGCAHTHGGNIGTMVEPYAYSMQGIPSSLIGINFAMDHVAPAAPGGWQILLRRWMPYIGNVCVEDLVATVNATTGALSINNIRPPGATGLGGGVINWANFYQLLYLGGYSGFSESQLEYSIIGTNGASVSLNNAAFADQAPISTGVVTPAMMIAEFKVNSDFIRARALAGGWPAAQII